MSPQQGMERDELFRRLRDESFDVSPADDVTHKDIQKHKDATERTEEAFRRLSDELESRGVTPKERNGNA